MNKKFKKLFGFLGIAIVVGMTVFAISLPSPEANATESLTDTIQIRVVGSTPDVNFKNIEDETVTVYPEKEFTVSYENVESYTLNLKYTDKNDTETDSNLDTQNVNYEAGERNYDMTLEKEKYGEYYLILDGVENGVHDYDYRTFYYIPVTGEIVYDDDTGSYFLELNYTAEEDSGDVAKIRAQIYDENEKLIDTIYVDTPTKSVEIEIPDCGEKCHSGKIYALLDAYDSTNPTEELYKSYKTNEADYELIDVPDTGSFLKELNISREDYLITGLITFGIIAIAGIVFLGKTDTNKKRAHVNAKRRRK